MQTTQQHNNSPVIKQLQVNDWIVELRRVAINYPRVPDNGIRKMSVERIITARRKGESPTDVNLNNDLALKLKSCGLC